MRVQVPAQKEPTLIAEGLSRSERGQYRRESASPNDKKTVFGGAQVGDLIQWESNGVLRLESPKRVRLVTDNGEWVAVEGSETGIPVNEVVVQEKSSGASKLPPTLPLAEIPSPKGTRKEIIILDEGDVVLTFPDNLSAASYEDLESHLQLFLRKAKRRAQ